MRRSACTVIAFAAVVGVWWSAEVAGPSTTDELFVRIDRYVQQEVNASRIPGAAVAIVRGGDIVHSRGFGHDGAGRPITPETPFPIGSLTKSFTALATRQLVEAGVLRLDDAVQRYLPWFTVADRDAAARITVRHLLNHASGFSRASGVVPVAEESAASLEQIVRGLAATPLNRPVGHSYEYSNLNYAVLGLLVETVAAQPWTTYIEQHVFAPVGMRHSYTTFEAAREAGMTSLHRYWFGVPRRSALAYLPGLAPTGYLAASVEDMARYLAVYLCKGHASNAPLLSATGIESMLTPATNEVTVRLLSASFTARYAEGWFVGPFGAASDARWHLGQLPSFAAWMVLLPDSNEGVVVLTNVGSQMELASGNAVLSRLPRGIVNLLRHQTPPAGISVSSFYAVFDVTAAAVLGALAWTTVRVSRARPRAARRLDGRTTGLRAAMVAAPSVWGLGLAVVVLAGVPAVTGTTWPMMWRFAPDLTLVLLTAVTLSASVGVVSGVRWVQWGAGRGPQ